jgi:BirA family transcriptional regulator, biotin operon repressor / biotin---[acetyl-CoA-carboxylase] ligase
MNSQLIGSEILRFSQISSTNAYAMDLLSKTRPTEGVIILADHQTEGRGMDTNSWESEPGKNLTFTIILYPGFLTPDRQFWLNQSISLGIAGFIRAMVPNKPITIKWPNDIYIGDKKVCGILIQHSIMGNVINYSVIGIGININQQAFISNAPNPVSIHMATSLDYDLDCCLAEVCKHLNDWYSQLKEGNHLLLEKEYLDQLYRFNEWHQYQVRGVLINARISGITEYGQLHLMDDAGKKWICDIKEIKYYENCDQERNPGRL